MHPCCSKKGQFALLANVDLSYGHFRDIVKYCKKFGRDCMISGCFGNTRLSLNKIALRCISQYSY